MKVTDIENAFDLTQSLKTLESIKEKLETNKRERAPLAVFGRPADKVHSFAVDVPPNSAYY